MRRRARRSLELIWPTDAWGVGAILSLTITGHLLVARPVVQARAEYDRLAFGIVERDRAVNAAQRRLDQLREDHAAAMASLGSRNARKLESITALNDRLDALGVLAETHGLTIVELARNDESSEPHYRTVSLRFRAECAFADAVAFMHALHGAEPHIAVTAFDVSGNGARETPVRLGLDLRWHAALPGGPVVQAGVDGG